MYNGVMIEKLRRYLARNLRSMTWGTIADAAKDVVLFPLYLMGYLPGLLARLVVISAKMIKVGAEEGYNGQTNPKD